MIKCKLCGASNSDDVLYCAFCGSKIADQIKPKKKTPDTPAPDRGVDLNLPFSFYKDYMSDRDLFNIGQSRLDGVILKKDENEGISIFVYLAKKGYMPALLKLADLCLKDAKTYNEAVILLKKAADGGSIDAMQRLQKMGIKYKLKNTVIPPSKPTVRPSPKFVDDDDEDEDEYDEFEEPEERYDLDDALYKTVSIKTRSTKNGKTIYGIGFITEFGYIATTYDTINRGVYKKIEGSINDGSNNFYKMKPVKISKKYNIVLLKFIDNNFEDVDFFDNLEMNDDFDRGDKVYLIGLINKSIKIEKCKIVELTKKTLTDSIKKAIKLKGEFNSKMVTPLVLNENGEIIGIIYDISSSKAYAAPAKYIFKVIEEAVED